MGLNVNLYAEGSVSDDELKAANEFLLARGVYGLMEDHLPLKRALEGTEDERIEWVTLTRFYDHGYERGWWPKIANAILCLKTALPQCRVFYGSDSTDYAPEATDELIASLWEHWLSSGGLAYRERRS